MSEKTPIPWHDLSQIDFAMSGTIGKIAKAMAEVRATLEHTVKPNRKGNFNNDYADLDVYYTAGQKALAEKGLTLLQPPTNNKISNLLMHESGEWIYSAYSLPPHKNDPQGDGGAITYGLRYTYGPIVGVSLGDDGDGESAMPQSSNYTQRGGNQSSPRSQNNGQQGGIDMPYLLERIRGCSDMGQLLELVQEKEDYVSGKKLWGRGIETVERALEAAKGRLETTSVNG